MASPTAPAAIPSEEEIKEIIANGCGCHRECEKHGSDDCGCLLEATTIRALFAPILAEKERRIDGLDRALSESIETSVKVGLTWQASAERAEARALSAEAERDALKTKLEMAAEAGESCRRARIADDEIDIRIEIDRGFSVCWRDRGCFSSRHTTDAEALPGLVADIIAEVRRARSASADIRGEG